MRNLLKKIKNLTLLTKFKILDHNIFKKNSEIKNKKLKLLLKNNPTIDTGLKLLKCKHNKEKDNLTIQFKNVNKLQFGPSYIFLFI